VLIDFGSCHFEGAARLTWQSLPPVTLEYLSPQAGLFHLHSARHPDRYYAPSPADDLYALGVTAYRLVMGQYPPPLKVSQDEQGNWQVRSPDLTPLLESNLRVDPLLREVVVRLLSDAPEARGTARQVAEALEAVAGETGEGAERPESPRPRVRPQAWKRWVALAAAGACAVLLWSAQRVLRPPGATVVSTPQASDFQSPDAGTAAVGDSLPTQPQASTPAPTEKQPLAEEPLPEPRPGQARPDQKGRCPGSQQVPINGGCWVDVSSSMDTQACTENGYVLFKGRCYGPAHAPPKKPAPTSSPVEAR
ncbi:MAG TPA: serine/threonine protein kinase, partial [Myxococcaceae bacterium]